MTNLPSDIRKYAKKRLLRMALKFIVFEVLFTLAVILFAVFILSKADGIIRWTICISLIIISVCLFEVPEILHERAWSGEITKVDIRSRSVAYSWGGRLRRRDENVIYLTVKTDKGKTIEKEVAIFSEPSKAQMYASNRGYSVGNVEHHIEDYHVGDHVYHFFGIERVLVVPKKPTGFCNCIVCGQRNSVNDDVCWDCGHTLLKNIKKNTDST